MDQIDALDAAAVTVPGLGFLIGSLVLPGALLAGLAAAALAVALWGVVGWLLTHRADVAAWPKQRAGRRIGALTGLAIALLVGYVLAYSAVVAQYAYPVGAAPEAVLVPAVLGDRGPFPYVDCTRSVEPTCGPGVAGAVAAAAPSAQGLADRMSADGPGAYAIPHGWAWRGWVIGLVGLHVLTGAALVALFGVLRIRHVDVAGFLASGDSNEPPGEGAAPSEGAAPDAPSGTAADGPSGEDSSPKAPPGVA